jgi:hypothetical protein
MFQVDVFVMFQSLCFCVKAKFLHQSHVSISIFLYQVLVSVSNPFFRLKGCFNSLFLIYFKVYLLFIGFCVSMFHLFHIFKKH